MTTDIEPTPAERATTEALHMFLTAEGLIGPEVPVGAYAAAASDIAAAAEGHHYVAAYDEATQALGHLASFSRLDNAPEGFLRGIEEAQGLIGRQSDALSDHLSEER